MDGKWQRSYPQPTEWVKGKIIGSGSFSTVHLAIDNATGSLFVAKCAETEAGIKSLKNEASILENLDSQYIIKSIGNDFSVSKRGENKCSVFFEYVAGGSIADVAQKFGGALDERVVRLYTKEILHGLKYLHQNGIVHSDVKCQNVLLGLSGTVKLADFGCAKRVSNKKTTINTSSNSHHSIVGTPLWMAPEVLRNEGLDYAADIWSLGCTVIEMATGKPPWDGDMSNPMAAVLKIAQGDQVPQYPRHVSAECLDFLAKCLDRDPKRRWTSEKLLNHPFVAVRKPRSIDIDGLSPASVLDVERYDYDCSCEEDDDEFESKVPFSTKFCHLEKKLMQRHASGNNLDLSDNWITVRTR